MASTRINPRGDLKKTASDLATFIMHGTPDELRKCLLEAKDIYQAPLNSWLTGFFYWIINSRTRFPRLDQKITEILSGYNESNLGKVIDIFSAGGWEETSYNTTLVRTLVKHLNDYDTSTVLLLQDVIELKVLLIIEQVRLINQSQILKQQSVIDRLKAKENEMRNELSELTRLSREQNDRVDRIKKDEQSTNTHLQQLTEMCKEQEQSLRQFQDQLKQLDLEKKKQEEELEKKKSLTLDADIDVSKLTFDQRERARKIAVASISTYVKDINGQDDGDFKQTLKAMLDARSAKLPSKAKSFAEIREYAKLSKAKAEAAAKARAAETPKERAAREAAEAKVKTDAEAEAEAKAVETAAKVAAAEAARAASEAQAREEAVPREHAREAMARFFTKRLQLKQQAAAVESSAGIKNGP